MGIRTGQSGIEVRVDENSTSASLYIPAREDADAIELDDVLALVRDKRLEITDAVRARLADIIADFKREPRRLEQVFTEAIPAQNGDDAYFEWVPELDPTVPRVMAPAVSDDEPVDFYNLSTLIRVKAGDHVAVFHEATPGVGGRDIYGRVIEPRPGKASDITLDSTLTRHPDGAITANIGGSLEIKYNTLRVSRMLDIKGCVDFSTGNIAFDGSIHVHDAVRDRFEVSATEDVIVDGLIEAATISAGRNCVIRRGMAARHLGQIRIEGNAEAGFLNNVSGHVRGDLIVRREIVCCELIVGGSLVMPDGVLLGGSVTVMKRARVGVLGSEGGAPTFLSLGESPLLEAELRDINMRLDKLRPMLAQHQYVASAARTPRGSAAVQSPEATAMAELIAHLEAQRNEVVERIRAERVVELHVAKMAHPRVCLRAFGTTICLGQVIKGPLVITWNPEHGLHYRPGSGGTRPLPVLR